jgi:hypothetical protein
MSRHRYTRPKQHNAHVIAYELRRMKIKRGVT